VINHLVQPDGSAMDGRKTCAPFAFMPYEA
jgi:hypothetical protein